MSKTVKDGFLEYHKKKLAEKQKTINEYILQHKEDIEIDISTYGLCSNNSLSKKQLGSLFKTALGE